MKYQYHDLYPAQFEDLIIGICEELFGMGVQGFSDGMDGGRDARFEGKAQLFPSSSEPWSGITIIQAKHTSGINRSFSERDFFGNDSAQINKEIPKIKRLFENDELHNYILFANRKLSAIKNEEILNEISIKTSLPKRNIHLMGIDDLERYLKKFSQALQTVKPNELEEPLKITPDELAEVIEIFAKSKEVYPDIEELDTVKEIKRKEFAEKNNTNKLSEEYIKIIKNHMFRDGYYDEITNFLHHPENAELKRLYEETVDDLKAKIAIYQKEYENFERLLDYIYDRLISRDVDLRKHKKATRVFLHYMYFYCDIG